MLSKICLLVGMCCALVSCLKSEVEKLSQSELQEIVEKSTKPIVIDFYADWCQPCTVMAPVIERVAEELKDRVVLVKANLDECKELAQHYQITSLPTCLIIKDHAVAARIVGCVDDNQLKGKIDDVLYGSKDLSKLSEDKLHKKLFGAMTQRDVGEIEQTVKAGVDVNKRFENGYTPLVLAIVLGPQSFGSDLKKVVALLLDAGAHLVIENTIEVANIVKETIANIKKYTSDYEELEKYLQEVQPKQKAEDKQVGKQAVLANGEELHKKLFKVMIQRDVEEIEQTVKAGVDVNKRFENGYTPLVLAVVLGPQTFGKDFKKVISMLFDAGAQLIMENTTLPSAGPIDVSVIVNDTIISLKEFTHDYEELEKYLRERQAQQESKQKQATTVAAA